MSVKEGVRIQHHIKDVRRRFKVYGVQRLKFARDIICREIRGVLQYPKLIRRLHPFERLTVELALYQHMQQSGLAFGKALACLKQFRQRIHEEAVSRERACMKADRGRLATLIADEGLEEIYRITREYEPIFLQFIDQQNAIFRAPIIDLDKPTVVFVGAPNVGKSSLVRSLSTGVPEVNDYAYTTRQLTIGHIWHFIAGTPLLIHGQIVDSPGMIEIGANENLMHQLTLGSMQHLPTGVVFVFDPHPTTHGLLSVEGQIKLREDLRSKFPSRPWHDVITKIDMEEDEVQGEVEKLKRRYPDATEVSALDGTGLDELNMQVRAMLEEMTRVVRQLQRVKIRKLRAGSQDAAEYVGKEALPLR